ncbi:hypothetical protein ACFWSA_30040, partial [Streptomyces albidoflavus]
LVEVSDGIPDEAVLPSGVPGRAPGARCPGPPPAARLPGAAPARGTGGGPRRARGGGRGSGAAA